MALAETAQLVAELTLRDHLTATAGKAARSLDNIDSHARKAGRRRPGRGGNGPTPADIRAWARDNGFDVPDRGRVSSEVREAYLSAH